jgi:hypothetical protein
MLVPVTASGHPGSIRSLLLFLPLLYFIFLLHDHDHDAAAPFTRQPRPRREHDATTATTTADTAALAKQDAPYYPHYDCYPDYHRRRHNQHYLTTYATHPRRTQGARSQHAETERSRPTEATRSDQDSFERNSRAPHHAAGKKAITDPRGHLYEPTPGERFPNRPRLVNP